MKRLLTATALLTAFTVAGCSRANSVLAAEADRPALAPAASSASGDVPANAPEASRPETSAAAVDPAYREVTIPTGTVLAVTLGTTVASDSSHVEDAVRGTLRRAVVIRGVEALPAGTALFGHVTAAERSARVKGRGRVAFRFNAADPPGRTGRVAIRTQSVSRRAPATKQQDAAKIGGAAAGGALIGGILGGGDGVAKGAAIGGAAGTGVVLSTRGKEVRLGPGTPVTVRLAAPVTIRVPLDR
jgi:hypothetical protein